MNSAAESVLNPVEAHARNGLASVWMKQGIALMEKGDAASLDEAVRCFDQAIELRQTLPLNTIPWYRYTLAAGWMNRGDALTRLGSAAHLPGTVHSFDEALAQLRLLPLEESPLYPKRFAIACLNRALALQKLGSQTNIAEALRSLDEGIALLEHEVARAIPERNQLLGCAWTNRGNLVFSPPRPDAQGARIAAKIALRKIANLENSDLMAGEAGFKARLVLCRALADLLARPDACPAFADELLGEATDTVDDGMKLAREWEKRNVSHLRALACELFRFGVHLYRTYQPHFLAEFILESLNADQSSGTAANVRIHGETRQALWSAFRQIQTELFQSLNKPRFGQMLEQLRELCLAELRLYELAS